MLGDDYTPESLARFLREGDFFVHGAPPGYKNGEDDKDKDKDKKVTVVRTGKKKPPKLPGGFGTSTYGGAPHKDANLPSDWADLKKLSIYQLQQRLDMASKLRKHCATVQCKERYTKEVENCVFLLNRKMKKGSEKPHHGKPDKVTGKTQHGDLPKVQLKKWVSAGGVVLQGMKPDEMDYLYVIKPSNHFGPWSFPKGRVDKGEAMGKTARREVEEESGIRAAILPHGYIGKGMGSHSVTHFFLMVKTGGSTAQHDKEVERVALLHWEEALKLFKRVGNHRDYAILLKARKKIEKMQEAARPKKPTKKPKRGRRPRRKRHEGVSELVSEVRRLVGLD